MIPDLVGSEHFSGIDPYGLGVEITSATFREVASAGSHEWVETLAHVSRGDPGGAFETVAPRRRWR